MACYFLAEIAVHDPALYRQYVEQASAIVPRYGGEYVFRSEAITPVSGGWAPARLLLIRFPSPDHLRRCFADPEYLAIAPLRERSTTSRTVLIQDQG